MQSALCSWKYCTLSKKSTTNRVKLIKIAQSVRKRCRMFCSRKPFGSHCISHINTEFGSRWESVTNKGHWKVIMNEMAGSKNCIIILTLRKSTSCWALSLNVKSLLKAKSNIANKLRMRKMWYGIRKTFKITKKRLDYFVCFVNLTSLI